MKYFFVDTENVQQYNFIDDFNLLNKDKIVMFMSKKSKSIRAEDLRRFTQCNAKIEYEDVNTGENNALDFQLIADLSLVIATNKSTNTEYFIVSNDNDFKIPMEYLIHKTNANIQILKTDTKQSTKTQEKIDTTIYSKFNLDKKTLDIIQDSKTLGELHNNLNNLLGKEKGRNLYKDIKTTFTKKDIMTSNVS